MNASPMKLSVVCSRAPTVLFHSAFLPEVGEPSGALNECVRVSEGIDIFRSGPIEPVLLRVGMERGCSNTPYHDREKE